MADSAVFDLPDWPFSPFTPRTIQELTDISNSFSLDDSPTTQNGSNPYMTSSSSSPTQLTSDLSSDFTVELENSVASFNSLLSSSNTNFFLPNPPNTVPTVTPSEQYNDEILCMIAEPKPYYRGRYVTEVNKTKGRPNRFIRADQKDKKHIYPTIKIPAQWRDLDRYYIRVTLVTETKSETTDRHYIHPYEIGTPDENVIEDLSNNSIYFGINQKETVTGEKSFRLMVKKKKHDELKSYGPMRCLDSDQPNIQHTYNSLDGKKIIDIYQLKKAQFVFTVAERCNNKRLLVPILHTSVHSKTMTDVDTDGQTTNHSSDAFIKKVKCIPQKGDWQGGDEVLIILPYPIKQKVYNISFDFGSYGQQPAHEIAPIDRKTILFRTPSCPFLPGDENLKASVFITENNSVFHPIDFYYLTPTRTTINVCSNCQRSVTTKYTSNKRRCGDGTYFEHDGVDIDNLVPQMNDLSLEQKSSTSYSRMPSDENSKFEKYLNQLRDALAIFLRTNDPSRLFRRTRALLSNCNENQPPLNDAIEHGHAHLALSLIEQIIDMPPSSGLLEKANENGETALLVAAKCNQWKLIKPILEKRCELTKQKDKDENNLLHLLANMDEDKGAETIKSILAIISNEMKTELLQEENKAGQTPAKVAQSHENTFCFELLNDVANKA